jgi:hypothetical protein
LRAKDDQTPAEAPATKPIAIVSFSGYDAVLEDVATDKYHEYK